MRKPIIAALTIGVLLMLAAARVLDLWWWRQQAVGTAAARAMNLAFIVSEYVREMFAEGDASLRQLALHSTRIGGPAAAAADWDASLASARAGLTGVGSISVTDADGIIRHSTQPAIVGQSRRSEYLFRELAAHPADDLVVDTPFLSAVAPHEYIIPIGRRLTTRGGAFDGTVVAVIMPAAPRGFFRTVDVGRRGALWVFHPDGFVLFREPSPDNPIGESAAHNPIFETASRGAASGSVEQALIPGGPVMLSAFRAITSPPLIVAVSLDRNEILTDWSHQAAGSLILFAALAVMMTATLVVLFRQMDAERRARDELVAASRLKDEFLMTVSHELRTPLTAIYGWARMLNAGTLSDAQKPAALQTIERNARMQTKLIDDLLDTARIIEGKLELERRSVSVADVVQHAVDNARPAAAAKRIELVASVSPSTGSIVADPERLQQVLWNLLSNAIKFTDSGGSVTLTASWTTRGAASSAIIRGAAVSGPRDSLEIAITDTGAGISAEFLPYVFDRFRQEHAGSRRAYGGLGLGLAIARYLVELHGGTITAESAGTGCGATFYVRIPGESPRSAPRGTAQSGAPVEMEAS